MEERSKAKVYINPNYKVLHGSNIIPLHQHNRIHINQNFAKGNEQQKNTTKIFLNPNFIKAREETIASGNEHNLIYNQSKCNTHSLNNNYDSLLQYQMLQPSSSMSTSFDTADKTSNVIVANKSRYTFVRTINPQTVKHQNLHENIQPIKEDAICPVRATNIQSPIVKSRYHLIRKIENKVPNFKSPNKAKLKISKYKVITISNTQNNNVKNYRGNVNISQHNILRNKILTRSQLNSTIIRLKNAKPVILSNNYGTELNINKFSRLQSKRKSYQTAIENIQGKSKINNIPCPLFSKYGKCLRKINGKCEYRHDKKHVTLCRKFLKGVCHDEDCCLSHELSMKKMPTCYFYLKGMCFKDNCPYLHVKLSEKTKLCQDFLRGYCEKGENCLFRHVKPVVKRKLKPRVYVQNTNSVRKIVIVKNGKSIKVGRVPSNEIISDSELKLKEGTPDIRYYKEINKEDPSCDLIKPTRCKLGTLPAFIQL